MKATITITELNPVCSIHGQAYHNGRCTACDKLEGIDTVIIAEQIGRKENEYMYIEIFGSKGKNNKIIAQSEAYKSKRNATDTAKLFKLKIKEIAYEMKV